MTVTTLAEKAGIPRCGQLHRRGLGSVIVWPLSLRPPAPARERDFVPGDAKIVYVGKSFGSPRPAAVQTTCRSVSEQNAARLTTVASQSTDAAPVVSWWLDAGPLARNSRHDGLVELPVCVLVPPGRESVCPLLWLHAPASRPR